MSGSIQAGVGGAWDQILTILQNIIVPDWNDWIAMLPIAVIVGVLGPILTLIALGWFHHLMTRRRGRVRLAEPAPRPAPLGPDGSPQVPANVPYCSTDGLLYPARARSCEVCGQELSVRCPVDDTLRPASDPLCRTCGTKYVLGAAATALTVRRPSGPPEGGAAVA
ncbi:MAG TPA: hypothetical protein VFW92_06600 [Candidatus Limnocylindrales bacterium]|nr:hypothetical protein [Candidatus Limnocylindrales bacterium]